MKVIDLLNKMSNGEEVPKKVKHQYYDYEWNTIDKDYQTRDGEMLLGNMNIQYHLNDEIILIEDEVDIDNINLDKIIKVFEDIEMCLDRLSVKISSAGQGSIDNYLDRYKYDLQAVKQLNEEIKSIKEK